MIGERAPDTLTRLIAARADATPDGLMAIDEQGRRLSFGAYARRVAGLAARLERELGVGEGTRVSWQLPTGIDALLLMGALHRCRAEQNPILDIYREREVTHIVGEVDPDLLVVGSDGGTDFERTARAATAGRSTEVLAVAHGQWSGGRAGDPRGDGPDPGTFPGGWIYYTSGTTSSPKGARHTDRTLRAAANGFAHGLDLEPSDRLSLVFPITHIGGGIYLWTALEYGCGLILDASFDDQRTVGLLDEHGVTHAGVGVPFLQAYLRAQRARRPDDHLFPQVRSFPCGGAGKPPQLHGELQEAFDGVGLVPSYGLTEAPILTIGDLTDSDRARATTEGRPVRGVRLRIADADGEDVPTGREGEVRAKGPQVMEGYVDPALDAGAFDQRGWLRTGDLGRLDDEGYLEITGRLKDTIIRKGESISAKEIEDLLYGHPGIAEAAVIGLPDETRGELVCGVVVPEDPAEPLDVPELSAWLADAGIARQKFPERVENIGELPRNSTGKILKRELTDRFAADG